MSFFGELNHARRRYGAVVAYDGATPTPLPALPLRQWVTSFPFALRFLFASRPAVDVRRNEVLLQAGLE